MVPSPPAAAGQPQGIAPTMVTIALERPMLISLVLSLLVAPAAMVPTPHNEPSQAVSSTQALAAY